ncbi:MAG: hypothetical protein ACYCZD_13665 [Rhodanobacter sp.]
MNYETDCQGLETSLYASEDTLDEYKIRMYRLVRNLGGPRVEAIDDPANDSQTILSNWIESKTQDGWTLSKYARVENSELIVLNDLEVKQFGKGLWLTPSESAKQVGRRILILSCALIVILCFILWKSAYLSLSANSQNNTNLALMTRTPLSLSRLEKQSKLINKVSHHIGDYRLKDIIGLLSDTANIASDANLELKAKFEAWEKINESASVDAKAYRDIQRNIAVTSQLQAQEIDRLHAVLAKADKPTLLYSIMWLVFSFFGGVVTSITADKVKDRVNLAIKWIFRKNKRKRPPTKSSPDPA